MEFDDVSNRVIGCAIEVHRTLGPGLIESLYRRCLEQELRLSGPEFQAEKSVEIQYKNVRLDGPGLRIDLVVENALIVELKVVEKLLPVHEAQLLTYEVDALQDRLAHQLRMSIDQGRSETSGLVAFLRVLRVFVVNLLLFSTGW